MRFSAIKFMTREDYVALGLQAFRKGIKHKISGLIEIKNKFPGTCMSGDSLPISR